MAECDVSQVSDIYSFYYVAVYSLDVHFVEGCYNKWKSELKDLLHVE